MTRRAVIHDVDMIKGPRYKARGLVTDTAIIIGWHMGATFSSGDISIVTCRTVIHDTLVIKPGTGKGRGVVACRAILRGEKMIH